MTWNPETVKSCRFSLDQLEVALEVISTYEHELGCYAPIPDILEELIALKRSESEGRETL